MEAVSPEVLEMFHESAQMLVDKIGAVEAVAASLAHISGTKEIKSRSLISGREVLSYTSLAVLSTVVKCTCTCTSGGYCHSIG